MKVKFDNFELNLNEVFLSDKKDLNSILKVIKDNKTIQEEIFELSLQGFEAKPFDDNLINDIQNSTVYGNAYIFKYLLIPTKFYSEYKKIEILTPWNIYLSNIVCDSSIKFSSSFNMRIYSFDNSEYIINPYPETSDQLLIYPSFIDSSDRSIKYLHSHDVKTIQTTENFEIFRFCANRIICDLDPTKPSKQFLEKYGMKF